jgi:hypothetical protein
VSLANCKHVLPHIALLGLPAATVVMLRRSAGNARIVRKPNFARRSFYRPVRERHLLAHRRTVFLSDS